MTKFTRHAALAAIVMALIGTVAVAGTMDARFGNTVAATYRDGSTTKFFYNKDGSLSATATQSDNAINTTGNWLVDGTNLCVTTHAAVAGFEAGKERCVPLNGNKVGDTWKVTAKDTSGKDISISVTIVSGR